MHCFTGSKNFAIKLLEYNAYFSASGIITFKNSKELQETFKLIPLEKLLIETDSPFLAPEPNRGRKNEPAYIKYTAEKLARIKEISSKDLINATSNNFNINNIDSEKKNVKTSINRNRIGQQNFRINVLSAYKYQCCVTRSDLIDAIEANHIHPYFGVNTNHVQNGIPLRADIHKLWTKGLLGINDQFKVILSEKAKNSEVIIAQIVWLP